MSSTSSILDGVHPFYVMIFAALFDCAALRTLIAVSVFSISIVLGLRHVQHQDNITSQAQETGHDRVARCKEIVSGSFLKYGTESGGLTFHQSRALPNKRLEDFFDISNGFTSSDEEFCRQFRTKVAGIISINENSWGDLMERARQVTRIPLIQQKDANASTGIPLVPLVQLIVFKFILPLIFPDSVIREDAKAINIATEAINSLWIASKTGAPETSELHKTIMKEELQKILPDIDWAPGSSPLNLILPAYETTWRAVFYTYASIAIRNDPRSSRWQAELHDFAKSPTRLEFQRIRGSGTSIEHIVVESLRLYPPTKSIYRQATFPTTSSDGVIESADILGLHRDPNTWGSASLQFDPTRWSNSTKKDKQLRRDAFMAFGSRPHVCPAQAIAPVLIAFLAAALVIEFGRDNEAVVTGRDSDVHSSEPLRTGRDAYASLRIVRH